MRRQKATIRLGRALLRDHTVSPDLWAKTVELFGRQGAVEITALLPTFVHRGSRLRHVGE